MRRLILFTILSFLFTFPLCAQDVTVIGQPDKINPGRTPLLKGTITDSESGKPISGATVYVEKLQRGTSSDSSGHYELRLPVGRHTIRFQFVGYENLQREILIYSDGSLNIKMQSRLFDMDEVVVEAEGEDYNVLGSVTGIENLDISEIEDLPTVLGEVDVVNTLKLLPGVNTVGEGSTGFNVRGGRPDQNLVMLEGAPLYNASHVLGLFSVFNPDVVDQFSLYKGHIPPKYGGRLSSVLNVSTKEESIEEFKLRGGIGIAASRLSAELPFNGNKSSLLLAGRASYSDWILSLVKDQDIKNSSAFFYDSNASLNHRINDNNRVSLLLYRSHDRFRYADRFGYSWSNQIYKNNWNSLLTHNLASEFSAMYGVYSSSNFEPSGLEAFKLYNGIRYFQFKEHLVYNFNEAHTFDFGLEWDTRIGKPERLEPYNAESGIDSEQIEKERSRELSVYAGDEYKINDWLQVNGGIRYTVYHHFGPDQVFNYEPNTPKSVTTITDTTRYGNRETIATYSGLEPRVSARFQLSPSSSFKMSYNRTQQYIHQITNATSPTPAAIWQVSTPHIEPQKADMFSVGYFQNFKDNTWETSLELYYKQIENLVEYEDFAELHLNDHLETDLLSGDGEAYGAELYIKKRVGDWTGWLSYAYTRTFVKVASNDPELTINSGEKFPSNLDQPHNLTLVAKRKLGEKSAFSLNLTYSTGRPITTIESNYEHRGTSIPAFSERNKYRIPDYIRLDISFTIAENIWKNRTVDPNRPITDSMSISFYNLLSRDNAFSVFYTRSGRRTYPRAHKLSVLGAVIPSVTYNISF
ncbi:TonB-dependent receptor [Aliifodinibius sp. S!AR15-10]|uniref:TonB-dependent receptor n=1 Tax=Aliifodinibius sp. S!AR15-10 TaxID=2950437 RepID=UPI002861E0D0|nr:TonB-dependent receptor [Aliifodinibius sp. S!AR15-10]MDR8390582.1 TonB-dependent receptor [Aliifodinibius sp. S!AR15-10]